MIDRFDADAFDSPKGRARLRLVTSEGRDWDVLVEDGGARLVEASGSRPDSVLTADPTVWNRIASDVRSGLGAFGAGRLTIRRNLHLGLLDATSGSTDPGG